MFSLVQSHFVDVLQQIQGRSCLPITLVESKDKKKKKCEEEVLENSINHQTSTGAEERLQAKHDKF